MQYFINDITYGITYYLNNFFTFFFSVTNGVTTHKRVVFTFVGMFVFIKVIQIFNKFRKGLR